MTAARPWIALLGVALATSAHAQDRRAQYRVLLLADGREITAEVLATEPTGLRLRAPQGEMLLPFELLRDMTPADADAYKLQEAWYVYVAAPDDLQRRLLEAYRWVPNTRIQFAGDVVPGLGAAGAAAASRCKGDFPCLLQETAEAPWMFVVSASSDAGSGAISFTSGLNTGGNSVRVQAPDASAPSLWTAVHESLMLDVPEGGPPENAFSQIDDGNDVRDPAAPPAPKRDVATTAGGASPGLSFVPVPGMVAIKQKNGGGVAAALAITGVGTAAWVGALGHTAQSTPELAGLSVVGFYATTVLANEITRKR